MKSKKTVAKILEIFSVFSLFFWLSWALNCHASVFYRSARGFYWKCQTHMRTRKHIKGGYSFFFNPIIFHFFSFLCQKYYALESKQIRYRWFFLFPLNLVNFKKKSIFICKFIQMQKLYYDVHFFTLIWKSKKGFFNSLSLVYWQKFKGLQVLQFLVSLLLRQVYWRFFEARLKWISRFIFTTVADFYRSTFKPRFESKRNVWTQRKLKEGRECGVEWI